MKTRYSLTYILILILGILVVICGSTTAKEHKPVFTMAVLSDVHVAEKRTVGAKVACKKFDQALSDIETYKPDLTIINGDLTNGNPEDYKKLLVIINQHKLGLLYVTMGNHEYYRTFKDPKWTEEDARQLFQSSFGLHRPYYDRYIHGYHLMFLAPEALPSIKKEFADAAWLSKSQLDWFAECIARKAKGRFVFLHQPLDDTVQVDNNRVQCVQSKELQRITQKYAPLVWFSGHTHLSIESKQQTVERNGVLYVGGGSTFTVGKEKQLWWLHTLQRQFTVSTRESQSRLIQVFPNYVKILARDHLHHQWLHTFDRTFPLSR